jgi:CubicO group peptidase (beta-lactamase class C family)
MSGGWGGFGAAGLSLAVGSGASSGRLWRLGRRRGRRHRPTASCSTTSRPTADVAAAPALAPATVAALEAAVDEGFEAVEAPGVQVTVVAPGHGDVVARRGPGHRRAARAAGPWRSVSRRQRHEDLQRRRDLAARRRGGARPRRSGRPVAGRLRLRARRDDPAAAQPTRPASSTTPTTPTSRPLHRARDEPTEVIAWARRTNGQVFEPGADWSYSNTGYYVTGMILEAVEGAPLAEVLRRRLLGPLGLDDTSSRAFEPDAGRARDGAPLGVVGRGAARRLLVLGGRRHGQ